MAEQPPQEAPIEVDFVADLACPWCYLGLVRLDRARAMRPDRPVRVRWRPFFLNPGMPPEGMDRATYVSRKFGTGGSQVYRRIEESGRADGVAFAFDRMPRTPNTLLVHRLILFAEEQGNDDALIRLLFRALFEDGRDVGRIEELTEIAGQAGLEPAEVAAFLEGDRFAREVHEAQAQAQRMGIRGVPVFIVDHQHAVSGAQPPEILAGLLDVAAATRQAPAAQ
ncbi:MAG TPA: DsbA family oxidoreductase [Geminicoccaceae bacterium]|nr:DsbA family oxidoreductase [Geminicoccaceae bacterium]